MPAPQLIMVAGPNGSGKTTLIESLRAAGDVRLPEDYVNADDLRAQRGIDARAAQQLARERRLAAIAARRSLLYETVMSHPSKIAELQRAARGGYAITVVFVATADPAINVERVCLRVAAGGHAVPVERIRARYRRSLALAPSALALAGHAYVYDNSGWGGGSGEALQALLVRNRLEAATRAPALWVKDLIRRVNARAEELETLWRSGAQPLALPDLEAGITEGPLQELRRHYALQLEPATGRLLLHDRALLPQALRRGRRYRIVYREGVAEVSVHANPVLQPVRS